MTIDGWTVHIHIYASGRPGRRWGTPELDREREPPEWEMIECRDEDGRRVEDDDPMWDTIVGLIDHRLWEISL